MPYLYHNAPEYLLTPVIMSQGAAPVLCAMVPDAEGRTHRIPPNTPWEARALDSMDVTEGSSKFVNHPIPPEKVAQLLCNNGQHYGLVVVPERRDGISIQFDVERAAIESARVREQWETAIVEKYVANAKAEQLQGRPIRPPAESIERILIARGMDLHRDYGIQPVGYKVSEAAAHRDRELADLRAKTTTQERELSEMKEMLAMLLEDKQKKSRKGEEVKAS